MNWTPYVATWALCAAIVIGLALYRRFLSGQEDDSIHISDAGAKIVSQQIAHAHRIDIVDKWGKSLTAVVVVAGLFMLAVYIYSFWQAGASVAVTQ